MVDVACSNGKLIITTSAARAASALIIPSMLELRPSLDSVSLYSDAIPVAFSSLLDPKRNLSVEMNGGSLSSTACLRCFGIEKKGSPPRSALDPPLFLESSHFSQSNSSIAHLILEPKSWSNSHSSYVLSIKSSNVPFFNNMNPYGNNSLLLLDSPILFLLMLLNSAGKTDGPVNMKIKIIIKKSARILVV